MKRIVIRSLPQAYEIIKEMNLSEEWSCDYRVAARESLTEILECRMKDKINRYMGELGSRDGEQRRNGYFSRHLLTELGDIELHVPRTRKISGVEVVTRYVRRASHVTRMILACSVLGLSTRKVSQALLPVSGEPVSASTVSRVARALDSAVQSFHRRPLKGRYRFLIFDGVVLKRTSGAGSVKRVVLVALGITHDMKKEVIDFYIAQGESEGAWEAFLTDLYRRGLNEEGVELIVVDGGKGLLAALPMLYPGIDVQRCWAHKNRNVLNYVKKKDKEAVKADLHKIQYASGIRKAQRAVGEFARKWKPIYPKAVACLLADEEQLLSFFNVKDPELWPQIRTTNVIERRFREVRRRTRPMGVFSDPTSMERILYAVFTYENLREKTFTPFLLTQNY
ncbi:MAG: IS256 family transposase [Deltaproteobacteria bacterium]|nr:IS256 family transposase [Deltaproteobacteria bacterium]MBW2050497.1 IS256 family transposase [Deltaproteobacteria bacterium]